MLKTRDLYEVPVLFDLLTHPEVYPFVRQKADTSDAFYFITKQTIEEEAAGKLISRTILDEYEQPIGTINLFDIQKNYGFLATWIGQPYFGKGYNKLAKEAFFEELFLDLGIEAVFMKIRKTNIRSLKAVSKLAYAINANEIYPQVYQKVNETEDVYDLFVIPKSHYLSCQQFTYINEASTDEEVS